MRKAIGDTPSSATTSPSRCSKAGRVAMIVPGLELIAGIHRDARADCAVAFEDVEGRGGRTERRVHGDQYFAALDAVGQVPRVSFQCRCASTLGHSA